MQQSIDFQQPENWYLDSNGVNVLTLEGEHVVDLHNDCEIVGIKASGSTVTLDLIRNAAYAGANHVPLNSMLHLSINNTADATLSSFEYPQVFEGIHALGDNVWELSVGESGFRIESTDKLSLTLAHELPPRLVDPVDIDSHQIISKWLEHAMQCNQMKRDGFDSAHVDELIEDIPDEPSSLVAMAFSLFSELIQQYVPVSKKFKAQLIIDVDYDEPVRTPDLKKILDGTMSMHSPPEIYLIKSKEHYSETADFHNKYVKLPFTQSDIVPESGVVRASYVYPRVDQDDLARYYLFEHVKRDT